jgi:hypothetical protein
VSDTRSSRLKMVKVFYHNVALISLCLLLSGCRGKAAGHRSEATNAAVAKSSRLDPSLDARIDTRVGLLSNRSIEYQGGVTWTGCILKSESANQLVWVGKPATSRLLRALRDPDKNLAAHVVLTAIWEPDKVSSARGSHAEFIWFRPKLAREDLGVAEEHWKQWLAESPATEKDYREAEARWEREIARTVPLLLRFQRTQ